jgi:signal transduction histidine kinase
MSLVISERMAWPIATASWFRKLITPPPNIPSNWGYFYVGSTAAYLCGLILQPAWIIIFFSLHAPIIASITIVMLLAFVTMIALNRAGWLRAAICIAYLEVTAHAALLTYYIGWKGCFHFYIMDLLAVWCVAPMVRVSTRLMGAMLAILLVVYLNHAYATAMPYYHLPAAWMTFFMIQSIAAAHVILAVAVYYYAAVNERIFRDRERLSRQLAEKRRVEGVAMLAGGVAHQFNNLLAGIMGNAELIGADTDSPRSRRHVQNIIAACGRGSTLSSSLLTYSGHKGYGANHRYRLGTLVRECGEAFAAGHADCRVALHIRDDDAASIEGYMDELRQAVTALLANAREATAAKPAEIAVTLASVRMTHGRIAGLYQDFGLVEGGEVCRLEVRDHGEGIAPEALHKLFEPFYTSRHQAGLGLSHVIGLLRMLCGGIAVESAAGEGARFTIYLPQAR